MNLLMPLGLYGLALAIRLLVAGEISFPTAEPSAYYVGVAHSLMSGEGLVSNGVWSYATPPLEVPKAAFELWLPMSTFVSAAAMSVLGTTFWAAQVGGALLGAAVAPLAWIIGRETAQVQGLDARRSRALAITSGLLAAVLSPLVLGSVVPDSYMPFTVFMLAAAILVPRVIGARNGQGGATRPSIIVGLGLGLILGLSYLSRQEVIWLGLTLVLMQAWVLRSRPRGTRLREAAARLGPVVVGGLLVVVPWLVRNMIELGSAFPGQAVENMFLIDNEDIFAFRDRPSATGYLAQDLVTIVSNPLRAAVDGFINVITLPAFPVGIAGLVALVGLWRSPALRRPTALLAVLASATMIFLTTMLLFPVATLWGTFMHSAGPLLVGLAVLAALGGDTLLAAISARREWERPNIVIAPFALVAMASLFTIFQINVISDQAAGTASRYAGLGSALAAAAEADDMAVPDTLITDHPMWLAEATGGFAIALPDEDLEAVMALSDMFDAPWVVVVGDRGRYPDALLTDDARACLSTDPARLMVDGAEAWLFRLANVCAST